VVEANVVFGVVEDGRREFGHGWLIKWDR
jgi:hypothetical protein